jgi:hypothetical protein
MATENEDFILAKEWRCGCLKCNSKEHRRKNSAADDDDDNEILALYKT